MHKKKITFNNSAAINNIWFFAERALIYGLIAIFLFITLFPLLWVFSTSFKPNEEAINFPPKFLPEKITFSNYVFVLTDPNLVRSLINSFVVSVGSTSLRVGVCALGGYAFARFEFKGKNLIMSVILGLFMIPVVINNILLFKNYFETIPKELEEAALIDGCSRLGVLKRITIPLSIPGFAIAAVLSFRFSWNEFILPIVLANRPDSVVFQVALYQFISIYR